MLWRCRDRALEIERPLVMGIVNITPDSFSDGGRYADPAAAIPHARRLLAEGADLLDLGAESTRPGSDPVPAVEQLRRLMPVLEALAGDDAILSVDTANAEVADRALAAGARIVNDVTALGDPAMPEVVARHGAGLVLMHMRGDPKTMQLDPRYEDVAREVRRELLDRLREAVAAGIPADRIAFDPGVGFGKAMTHNYAMLARLDELAAIGRPVVVGVSRKSFIGRTLDLPVDQRLEGSLAAASIAVFQGALVIRTHDVMPTVRAVRIAHELRNTRRDSTPAHLIKSE